MFKNFLTWLGFWEASSETKRQELLFQINELTTLLAIMDLDYGEGRSEFDDAIYEARIQRLAKLQDELRRLNFYKN